MSANQRHERGRRSSFCHNIEGGWGLRWPYNDKRRAKLTCGCYATHLPSSVNVIADTLIASTVSTPQFSSCSSKSQIKLPRPKGLLQIMWESDRQHDILNTKQPTDKHTRWSTPYTDIPIHACCNVFTIPKLCGAVYLSRARDPMPIISSIYLSQAVMRWIGACRTWIQWMRMEKTEEQIDMRRALCNQLFKAVDKCDGIFD